MRLYDAHNHLQDDRLADRSGIIAASRRAGVVKMVVNGACEGDWPAVAALAREFPEVVPSFGYHPWYLRERSESWVDALNRALDQVPSAVGEIGLDRWKPDLDYAGQEEAFVAQLRIAAERNVAASIHCLQAWGRTFDLLRETPRPRCGFLLHSYGGPREMIDSFTKLGAYFSFPGYFAHERKIRQRETFRHVPLDRLLIETDAPDQHLPDRLNQFPIFGADGKPLNHPANLAAVYAVMAELRGMSIDALASIVEQNFLRLFGSVVDGRR